MPLNYTDPDEIIRGSRWPPAADLVSVSITNPGGWPVGADGWDWYLHLSRDPRGDPSDLILTATAVNIVGNVLEATFFATAVETLTLPHAARGKARRFYVDIRSVDGTNEVSFYDCVSGYAWVRNYAGQGD